MLRILLIVLAPIIIGVLGAGFVLGSYSVCRRLGFDTGAPWFAVSVAGAFVAVLYIASGLV